MITWENYEEYMMMHADGELRSDEEQELLAFVNKHPQLKKEMAVYELTRLTPDTTQVFAHKNSLLKPVTTKKTIAFPQWRKYSIAAGIAALIFISLFKYMTNNKVVVEVAKTDTVKYQTPKATLPEVAAKNVAPELNSKPGAAHDTIKMKPVIHRVTRIAVMHKVTKEHKKQNDTDPMQPVINEATTISELSLAGIKQMPCNKDRVEVPGVKNIPAYTIQNSSTEVRKTFWDKLPMDDIKKKQIAHIAGTVADVYNDINTAKQNLYDKSITIDVKVEKRKLIISF